MLNYFCPLFVCNSNMQLVIYCGIMDGINGSSTSIEQPINFYNKILNEWSVKDSSFYIDYNERNNLLQKRNQLSKKNIFIDNRLVIHHENYKNINFVIFDGAHEILINEVIENIKKIDSNERQQY